MHTQIISFLSEQASERFNSIIQERQIDSKLDELDLIIKQDRTGDCFEIVDGYQNRVKQAEIQRLRMELQRQQDINKNLDIEFDQALKNVEEQVLGIEYFCSELESAGGLMKSM